MSQRNSLLNDDKIIYIVTRLYNYIDKLQAEKVEQSVIRGIRRAIPDISLCRSTPFTFVPFRDTDEHNIIGPNKAELLFEQDKKRLDNLFALVGFYDGVSKDEGASFEIGYAFGKQAPIILVLTDFIHFVSKCDETHEFVMDPILEAIASYIVRHQNIPTGDSFARSLESGLDQALSLLEARIYDICAAPHLDNNLIDLYSSTTLPRAKRIVYIDFGGGTFEWQRVMQNKLIDQLARFKGIDVEIGIRYEEVMRISRSNNTFDIKQIGYRDILAALKSDTLVLCVDSDEVNAGVAALQGLAVSLNKPVILYDSRTTWFVSGDGLKMSRNLMLDQSATIVVDALDKIPAAILSVL